MNDTMENYIELPIGWVQCRIGDVCRTTSGGTPSRSNKKYYEGNIPWLKSGELKNSLINEAEEFISEVAIRHSSTKLLPKGTLLIALYGATVGRLGILNIDAAINQAICAIFPHENILSKYLFWFFTSYRESLLNQRKGGAQPNISQQIINDSVFRLPPLPEQHRIVEKLEELFTKLDVSVEELKKAKAQIKRYRQSVLKSAFEGKLTEEWRTKNVECRAETAEDLLAKIKEERKRALGNKYKELPPVDTTNLPKLPEGWVWVKVENILEVLTDYHANGGYETLKMNVELLDSEDYALMVRTLNLERKDFVVRLKYISEAAYNFLGKSKLFGGEIIIGKIGNAGKVYFMPEINRPASLGMNMFLLRFVKIISNKYIYMHLTNSFSKDEIKSKVKGVGNPTIDKKSLRDLHIALCPPLEQQQIISEIERHFSVADATEKIIDQSLKQAERLRQSILKDAFAGKLVPQDLNDPPAILLLEKIKKEKANSIKEAKPKRRTSESAEKMPERIGAEKEENKPKPKSVKKRSN